MYACFCYANNLIFMYVSKPFQTFPNKHDLLIRIVLLTCFFILKSLIVQQFNITVHLSFVLASDDVIPCSLMYGAEDPSIAGMVLDSPFSDLVYLMMELVDTYRFRLPKFTVSEFYFMLGTCEYL